MEESTTTVAKELKKMLGAQQSVQNASAEMSATADALKEVKEAKEEATSLMESIIASPNAASSRNAPAPTHLPLAEMHDACLELIASATSSGNLHQSMKQASQLASSVLSAASSLAGSSYLE